MKKIIITAFALLFTLLTLSLFSCTNTDGTPPPDSGSGEQTQGGIHYTAESDVRLVLGDGAERDTINKIKKLFFSLYGYYPKQANTTDAPKDYEIIIGECDREISRKAYSMLDEMQATPGVYAKYLVLAENGQIAFAFDSFYLSGERLTALSYAVDLFVDYFSSKESIDAEDGILFSGSVDLIDVRAKECANTVDLAWQNLYSVLSRYPEQDKVYAAIKNYYTLYDKRGLATWFAGLYDPDIGGYYYSSSARDNAQFKPDAESTSQALSFISSSGLAMSYGGFYGNVLPDAMKKEIIAFLKGMQDPNGYFYHSQWGKALTDSNIPRRSRDLNSCVAVLTSLGSAPTYDTPTGAKGDGIRADGTPVASTSLTLPFTYASAPTVASKVVAAAAYSSHLENDVTFRAYLDKLLRDNSGGLHFYFIGNQLTSEMSEIQERDRQLAKEGADYSLVKILIEWLNSHQNPENGLWEPKTDYLGVNGLVKISGIYSKAGVEIPNADKAAISAIEAITSNEEVDTVVDIFNAWSAVRIVFNNMMSHGQAVEINGTTLTAAERVDAMRASIIANADVYVNATREKLALFKKADGSFSYYKNMTSSASQGMHVAVSGTNEGDVNATFICVNDITSQMLSVLQLTVPPILTDAERILYMYIIEQNRMH